MLIKYKANGMERDVRDSVAQALIRRRLASPVEQVHKVQRQPGTPTAPLDDAPYGRKADGTPRARPGRKAPDSQPAEGGTYTRRDVRAED